MDKSQWIMFENTFYIHRIFGKKIEFYFSQKDHILLNNISHFILWLFGWEINKIEGIFSIIKSGFRK